MLISLLVTIIILGLLYWAVTLLPLPEPFRQIALVVFIIIAIVYVVLNLEQAATWTPMLILVILLGIHHPPTAVTVVPSSSGARDGTPARSAPPAFMPSCGRSS